MWAEVDGVSSTQWPRALLGPRPTSASLLSGRGQGVTPTAHIQPNAASGKHLLGSSDSAQRGRRENSASHTPAVFTELTSSAASPAAQRQVSRQSSWLSATPVTEADWMNG